MMADGSEGGGSEDITKATIEIDQMSYDVFVRKQGYFRGVNVSASALHPKSIGKYFSKLAAAEHVQGIKKEVEKIADIGSRSLMPFMDDLEGTLVKGIWDNFFF